MKHNAKGIVGSNNFFLFSIGIEDIFFVPIQIVVYLILVPFEFFRANGKESLEREIVHSLAKKEFQSVNDEKKQNQDLHPHQQPPAKGLFSASVRMNSIV